MPRPTSSAARSTLDRYGLIYAGAQKNIGPAGVTVVLVHDDFLQQRHAGLPTMLDYGTHAAKMFNTPPVFAVYMVEKVLRWLKDASAGSTAMEQRNDAKAAMLYGAIDATDFYRGTAREDSRSKMNVTFRLADESLEPVFVEEAKKEGLARAEGLPHGRRHPRVDLQRVRARVRRGARAVHAGVRAGARLRVWPPIRKERGGACVAPFALGFGQRFIRPLQD